MKTVRLFTISVVLLQAIFLFTSCGFAYKKHITGRYYIIGADSNDNLSLSYDLTDGNSIGKAPPMLIAYGFNKTFVVAKCLEYGKVKPTYYIINMTKDSEYAHEETFRIGPISENEYNLSWRQKIKVKSIEVE